MVNSAMTAQLYGPIDGFDAYTTAIVFARNTAQQEKQPEFSICALAKGNSSYSYFYIVGEITEGEFPKPALYQLSVIAKYKFIEGKWELVGYRNLNEEKWQIPS
jgi:hypothetical protein